MKTGDKIIAIINDVHITKGKEYTIYACDNNLYGLRNDVGLMVFFEKRDFKDIFKFKTSEKTTPEHYDNTNGSLYLFAEQHKLNAWEFDIIKRIVRCRKKGNFIEDLHKTIEVIKLYENETNENGTDRHNS